MYSNDMKMPITIACQAEFSALRMLLPPRALTIEEATPPPIAPLDIIPINVWKGKTIAKLARAVVPI